MKHLNFCNMIQVVKKTCHLARYHSDVIEPQCILIRFPPTPTPEPSIETGNVSNGSTGPCVRVELKI